MALSTLLLLKLAPAGGGRYKIPSDMRTVGWVLFGSGEANKGYDLLSLNLQLVDGRKACNNNIISKCYNFTFYCRCHSGRASAAPRCCAPPGHPRNACVRASAGKQTPFYSPPLLALNPVQHGSCSRLRLQQISNPGPCLLTPTAAPTMAHH